jgi:hypothetical protein
MRGYPTKRNTLAAIRKALDRNDEYIVLHTIQQPDGTFVVAAFVRSRPFKTLRGASAWMRRKAP